MRGVPAGEHAIDLAFGLQPIIQFEAIDVSALRVKVIRSFADHAMPQLVADLPLRIVFGRSVPVIARFAARNGNGRIPRIRAR